MESTEFTKKYYKIGEVAALLNVPQSTLRYWETEFKQLRPQRTSHNRRTYTQSDLELLQIIHYLLHVKGMKIEAVKEQLRTNRKNISRKLEVIENLQKIREDLDLLLKSMNLRAKKIGLEEVEP